MADVRLDVRGLATAISAREGIVEAVRDVSFSVAPGETLGLVGESGSGKTITALSITRLLPAAARIRAGQVLLGDVDVVRASQRELRRIRGGRVAMVFQDSMTSLNPLLTIGRQITENIDAHLRLGRREVQARAATLLEEVGVPEPKRRLQQYPHQLSGGLRQRVAVAVALAANPEVLIADEPTTALDVTTQAQLLDLLRREQRDRGMSLILITHDLGVVAGMADRVAVMYAGRIVETAPIADLFAEPRHPYTRALLASVPRIDAVAAGRLHAIPGTPPLLWALPDGCPFRPRCGLAVDRCAVEDPALLPVSPGHLAACHVEAGG
jgi:oligopeptide/dipeptide ABC transporter ATP-binding protein